MSIAGALAALIVVVVLAAGAYFAYSGGYLQNFAQTSDIQIPGIEPTPQAGQSVEQAQTNETYNDSVFLSDFNLYYPTLFPNPRWNHASIRYYINASSGQGLPGFGDDDIQYVRDGTKVWEEKTGGTISFVEVSNPADSEVTFSWYPKLSDIKSGKVVGEGGPTKSIDIGDGYTLILGGEVFLIPSDEKCVAVNRVVHELGHVLGLGHVQSTNDIMFPKELSCDQTITGITSGVVHKLYEQSAMPDLALFNITAVKHGSYVDVNFTARDIGLVDSPATSVRFFADGKLVQSIEGTNFTAIPSLTTGAGIASRITNAKVSGTVSNFTIVIDPDNLVQEMDESNNRATLVFAPA